MNDVNYKDLIDKINTLDDSYYNNNESIIPDGKYDDLFSSLLEYEEENPDKVSLKSPSKRVGKDKSKGFKKLKHDFEMLSINDVFETRDESTRYDTIYNFLDFLGHDKVAIEPKIDGCAISLVYENGALISAITRGDGITGDDVTNNVKTIKSIPHNINQAANDININQKIIVRGEIFIKNKDFEKLNNERELVGEQLYANPRNLAAGSIKQLDSSIAAERPLSFLPYSLYLENNNIDSNEYYNFCLNFYKNNGFTKDIDGDCISFYENINRDTIHTSMQNVKNWSLKHSIPIDGAVIKVMDEMERKALGSTARAPRWCVAFKFLPEQVSVKINNIVIQVGRTGALTPVAEFDPVHISGSMVSRATLHNQDEIDSMNVNISDRVIVEKAGEIIPYIREVVEKKSDKPFNIMEICNYKCPTCSGILEKYGSKIMCTNEDCEEKIIRNIINFANRDNLNIKGLGEEVAISLVKNTEHISPSEWFVDILYKPIDWNNLIMGNGILGKTGDNIRESLNEIKNLPLHKIISALGIPSVGVEKAKLIATETGSLHNLMKDYKTLSTKLIGPSTLKNIVKFFNRSSTGIALMIDIIGDIKEPVIENKSKKLNESVFVLTGKLFDERSNVAKLIKSNGGKVNSAISKNVDYLVCGLGGGSKRVKADKLGIKCITGDDLLAMIEQS